MQTEQLSVDLHPGETRGWWPKPPFEANCPTGDTCGLWRIPEFHQELPLTAACQS